MKDYKLFSWISIELFYIIKGIDTVVGQSSPQESGHILIHNFPKIKHLKTLCLSKKALLEKQSLKIS